MKEEFDSPMGYKTVAKVADGVVTHFQGAGESLSKTNYGWRKAEGVGAKHPRKQGKDKQNE